MTKDVQRSRDDKDGKIVIRKCLLDAATPNHRIGECPNPPKDRNPQSAFVGGSWKRSGEDDDVKVKDKHVL
ncbi:hypothetical protein Tco_0910710 [Tanacetum coccineum]|uniref:Uncharacterized protein n=1 Tax=Tanacetum coccineum TaxID=301880 RepID=A0ABQ5CTM6_9ASTR